MFIFSRPFSSHLERPPTVCLEADQKLNELTERLQLDTASHQTGAHPESDPDPKGHTVELFPVDISHYIYVLFLRVSPISCPYIRSVIIISYYL